jgi:hypothetical protein
VYVQVIITAYFLISKINKYKIFNNILKQACSEPMDFYLSEEFSLKTTHIIFETQIYLFIYLFIYLLSMKTNIKGNYTIYDFYRDSAYQLSGSFCLTTVKDGIFLNFG